MSPPKTDRRLTTQKQFWEKGRKTCKLSKFLSNKLTFFYGIKAGWRKKGPQNSQDIDES